MNPSPTYHFGIRSSNHSCTYTCYCCFNRKIQWNFSIAKGIAFDFFQFDNNVFGLCSKASFNSTTTKCIISEMNSKCNIMFNSFATISNIPWIFRKTKYQILLGGINRWIKWSSFPSSSPSSSLSWEWRFGHFQCIHSIEIVWKSTNHWNRWLDMIVEGRTKKENRARYVEL